MAWVAHHQFPSFNQLFQGRQGMKKVSSDVVPSLHYPRLKQGPFELLFNQLWELIPPGTQQRPAQPFRRLCNTKTVKHRQAQPTPAELHRSPPRFWALCLVGALIRYVHAWHKHTHNENSLSWGIVEAKIHRASLCSSQHTSKWGLHILKQFSASPRLMPGCFSVCLDINSVIICN